MEDKFTEIKKLIVDVQVSIIDSECTFNRSVMHYIQEAWYNLSVAETLITGKTNEEYDD